MLPQVLVGAAGRLLPQQAADHNRLEGWGEVRRPPRELAEVGSDHQAVVLYPASMKASREGTPLIPLQEAASRRDATRHSPDPAADRRRGWVDLPEWECPECRGCQEHLVSTTSSR